MINFKTSEILKKYFVIIIHTDKTDISVQYLEIQMSLASEELKIMRTPSSSSITLPKQQKNK